MSGKSRYPATILAAAVVSLFAFGAPAQADKTGIGSYIPRFSQPLPPHPNAINAQSRMVGRRPLIVSIYRQWRQRLVLPAQLDPVWNGGSVPMITWEPFSYSGGHFPLRKIAHGRYDGYLRKQARAAAAWGHPILLRFAHEMNGSWYPWGLGVDGNTPARYKRAWRHVVSVFRAQGANDVQWVWAPQVNKDGKYPFRRLYPGNSWVDWVGMDGYNAGVRGNWDSFTEIFGDSYDTIVNMTSRPILVTETGSSQSGGDKAEWVQSALEREIPKFSRIRAVVWFNAHFNRLDFRIASSASALSAFKAGVSSSQYDESRAELLGTPKQARRPAVAPSAPSGDFGQPSLWYRLTQKLHGRSVLLAIAGLGLAVLVALMIVLTLRAGRHGAPARHASNTRP
jgi:Glycosyl hydrolase family 26